MSQLRQTPEQRPSTLVVLAKAPIPGFVKTRLCPPCTADEAAALAEAALLDTLDAADQCATASTRILALDRAGTDWRIGTWPTIEQRQGTLNDRLTGAFHDVLTLEPCRAGAFLIAMDTPQVSSRLLADALDALHEADAVIGPTCDGGYWGIGLRCANPDAFTGVPMSVADTYARQHERLVDLGLGVAVLAELRDIDTYEDALAVAELAPATRVGRLVNARRHSAG